MSLDLMVWASHHPDVSDAEAYEALCDDNEDVVTDSPAIAAFAAEVLQRHPDLDELFSVGDRKRYVSFTLPFSTPEEVVEDIQELIVKHGLHGWDPQLEEPLGRWV
ncbi:hypothetical protein [Cryptosporangium japonicum]|uniref:Uncharacterized protein n=1 Tax=Cryptosporangium japonicum TaxID=80872 RepID=A0ABP3EWA8_9ACTN